MKRMLTVNNARKLGVRYIDLGQEKNKIDRFVTELNSTVSLIESTLPKITNPPNNTYSPGLPGSISIDEEFLYVCTKTNNWKRINLNEL
jgi:hypothetical protein